MKTRKSNMTIDELKLLDTVKDFTDLEGLCQFFNRSQRTIRNALWKLKHNHNKYYYSYHYQRLEQATAGHNNGRIKKHLIN